MSQDTVISLALQAMALTMKLGLPLLLAALLVGLAISIFQAVTQIQEQTLAFIPKVMALALVIVVGGPWMLSEITTYTTELYTSIPRLVGQ